MIMEPMLGAAFDPEKVRYPLLATPKIDGIRFYTHCSMTWSRSCKPIPNLHFRRAIPALLGDHFDGEIFCGSFGATESFAMSDFASIEVNLSLFLFDYVEDMAAIYMDRTVALSQKIVAFKEQGWTKRPLEHGIFSEYRHHAYNFAIVPLFPVWIKNYEQLEQYYERCLSADMEGIILRDPKGLYKCGRSTLAEGGLLKYKPQIDREATIIGFTEKLQNTNPAFIAANGRSTRSKSASGLTPMGTLGAFVVKDTVSGVRFKVGGGPGLTEARRRDFWNRRDVLVGKTIEYRSMPYGVKDAPRHPQFLCVKEERIV